MILEDKSEIEDWFFLAIWCGTFGRLMRCFCF